MSHSVLGNLEYPNGTLCGNVPSHHAPDQPGEWQICGDESGAYISYGCPLRPGQSCGVPINTGEKRDRHWLWDGNKELPTLTPSINCLSTVNGQPAAGCGWHGHITAGVVK
jgi:hypothetical protein